MTVDEYRSIAADASDLTANQHRGLAVLAAGHCERRIVYVSNKTTMGIFLRIHSQTAEWFDDRGYIEGHPPAGTVRLTPAGRELAIEAGL